MSKKSNQKSNSKTSRKSSSEQQSGSSAPATPAQCTAGCGFFGNAAFDGLCSMCYRDKKDDQNRESGIVRRAAGSVLTPLSAGSGSKTSLSGPKAVSFANQATPPSASSAPASRPPTPYSASSKATPKLAAIPAATMTTPKSGSLSILYDRPKVVGSTATPILCGPLPSSTPTGRTTATATLKRTLSLEQATPESHTKLGDKLEAPSTDGQSKSNQTEPESASVAKKSRKQQKQRCAMCPTSLAVIGFDCRCGRRFCVVHQLAEKHGCNFDYRAAGQAEIRKANPKVVAEKIKKI